MKKGILILLAILLLLGSFSQETYADDSEFAANESYYRTKCTGTLTSADRNICSQFQQYLNKKIKEQQNKIEEVSNQITSVEADLDEMTKLLQQQEAQIEDAQAEIAELNGTIAAVEDNIASLQAEIEERQKEILAQEAQIKERIAKQQVDLHVNSLLQFLFGGSSYTQLARRANVADKLGEKDKAEMDEYSEEKALLEEDKVELDRQKVVLDESLANVKSLKASLEVAKAESEKTVIAYREEVQQLNAQAEQMQQNASLSQGQINDIIASFDNLAAAEEAARQEAIRQQELARQKELEEQARQETESQDTNDSGSQEISPAPQPVTPSPGYATGSGWRLPVTGVRVSAGAWYYPGNFLGGMTHWGVDLAGPIGRPIVSTGPGVVVYTNSSCGYGYLGSTCGYGGGNQVNVIVSMNNKLYGLIYAHLSQVNVSRGQSISAGTVLGLLGSSGNSSGPHLHHEVIYLGDMSITEYLSTWNGSISFNGGYNAYSFGFTCENRGGVAPCRIKPDSWYGVSVGGYY